MKTIISDGDGEKWGVGNVLTDGSAYFLIVCDTSTNKIRLVSLFNGNITSDEYKSINDLRQKEEELNPASFASLVVSH